MIGLLVGKSKLLLKMVHEILDDEVGDGFRTGGCIAEGVAKG